QYTSLAQGDIGSFLLRRQDVPGQDTAAHFANVLVSAALFATVMGLVFTLYELSSALRSTAQAPAAPTGLAAPGVAPAPRPNPDPISVVMGQVQRPLGRLPWLFVPTGCGLLLALISLFRQREVDERVEITWQDLDR